MREARVRLAAFLDRREKLAFLQLDAVEGRLCMIGGDEVVLVVVAERDANVGLIRVEMLRAAEALA